MKTSKTVQSEWEEFRREVLSPNGTKASIHAARKIFYGGAISMFSLLLGKEELTDDYLDRIHQEIMDFEREVETEAAERLKRLSDEKI